MVNEHNDDIGRLPTRLEIKELILNTCREMTLISKREFGGKWKDGANDEGLVIINEGLSSFLIPGDVVPDIKDRILFEVLGKEKIIYSLNSIIRFSEKDFYGHPYVDFSKYDKEGNDHGFLDAPCFIVTNIILLKKLVWEEMLAEKEMPDDVKIELDELDQLLVRALGFIDSAYIPDKGWAWGTFDKPNDPFIYCTWMAIETLSDLLEDPAVDSFIPPDGSKYIEGLKKKVKKAKLYMEKKYINPPPEEYNKDITKGTIAFSERDRGLNYNLWVTISLLLTKSKKSQEIEEALTVIWEDFKKDKRIYLRQPFIFPLDSKTKIDEVEFKDRAFLPLVLKAFCLFAEQNRDKFKDVKDKIVELYTILLQNRDSDKYLFVWDKYAEKDSGYAIYYTERAIEALCRLYTILPLETTYEPTEEKDVSRLELEELIKLMCAKLRSDVYLDIESKLTNFESRIKNIERNLPSSSEIMAQMIDDKKALVNQIKKLIKDKKYLEAKALIVEGLKKFPDAPDLLEWKKGIEDGEK